MTEPVGPDAHLGLDRIADLEEGLLSPAEEQATREHLAGCEVCQRDLAALAGVHEALLADAEIAMPDDVAARLFAALADEPPLAPAAAAPTTLPLRTGPSRWERSRKPLLASLAAAACIGLLAVGIIHLPRSSGSKETAAAVPTVAAAAATSAAGPAILHSGHDYNAKTLGSDGRALVAPPGAAAATGAAAAAATTGAAPLLTAGAAPTVAAASAAAPAPSSPTFAAAAGGHTSAAAPAAPAATTDALAQLRDPAAAQRCIALLLGSTTPPLVVDYATFAGQPAVIAVVDDPKDPAKLAVIAVAPPGCSLRSLSFVSKP